ncbi:Uncharacterized membrane protein [Tranquillimonas rosea]|uniref:Uncharacterized membrane protein n=1 Tax=Tranquillimonas rosea TaxID=641238 RepID=A0A1H9WFQ6_9RHOB|nr:DUF2244 domain-containing protein [Tranquillimonas rosea]SES32619.1 Uncharacterized membrane protein [Tranquillimonas rosea]
MPLLWDHMIEGAPVTQTGAFSHEGGAPLAHAHLWPHRSLPKEGFVWFIAITFALLMVPLIPVLGTVVLWGLLPFLLGALWALYYFLQRSYRDGEIHEELTLWSDRIELKRTNPRGEAQEWHANPYWVRVELHETGGPVANYVTLSGAGREVEIGAFLSEDERTGLYEQLKRLLGGLAP